MMDTPNDWEVVVWENGGWFWKLKHIMGHLSLWSDCHRLSTSPKFHAMLSTDADAMGCDHTWYDSQRFENPNEAVKHRLKLAASKMDGINKLLFKFNPLRVK